MSRSNLSSVSSATSTQQSLMATDITELRKSNETNTELLRTILSHITPETIFPNNQNDVESCLRTSLDKAR